MAGPEGSELVAALWEQRSARAGTLAGLCPPAFDLLSFYGRLARYQKSVAVRGARDLGAAGAETFKARLGEKSVLDEVPPLLAWLIREAPAPLAADADDMRDLHREEWRRLLDARLEGDPDLLPAAVLFVLEAAIQPLAEVVARQSPGLRPGGDPARCPACGDRPVVGVLREEGHGARRFLICALCLSEWDFGRVVCHACGEDKFDALAIYTAEQFAHVRVEACQSCRHYLKTVDSSKDGHAIPIVDDVATISLDLWAREQGFRRLRSNLLRL
jgi:FdhE protein